MDKQSVTKEILENIIKKCNISIIKLKTIGKWSIIDNSDAKGLLANWIYREILRDPIDFKRFKKAIYVNIDDKTQRINSVVLNNIEIYYWRNKGFIEYIMEVFKQVNYNNCIPTEGDLIEKSIILPKPKEQVNISLKSIEEITF